MKPRVVTSLQNDAGDHCVDVFARPDGTFGFEEYRRDHEDGRGWFSLDRFAQLVFIAQGDALAEAKSRVEWLAPEPALRIRRATQLDRDALEALYGDCRREARWLPEKRSQASFAQVSGGEAVFVAVASTGTLEGLLSVWESEPFVHHLYVREDARRKGVAEALLKSLVGFLPFPWRLKCVRANQEALDFYLKRGWKEIDAGEGSEGAYVELRLAEWETGIS